MSLFEDTGFDLLPYVPLPGNSPATIQPIAQPPVAATNVAPIVVADPDPIQPKKKGGFLGWFLFGLFVVGTIGATIYIANKDNVKGEGAEN